MKIQAAVCATDRNNGYVSLLLPNGKHHSVRRSDLQIEHTVPCSCTRKPNEFVATHCPYCLTQGWHECDGFTVALVTQKLRQ